MSILDFVALLPMAYFAVLTIPLILIDYAEHRLPNKIVLPSILLGIVVNIVLSVATHNYWNLLLALGLPLLVFIGCLVANYFNALGMGDAKLIAALLLALGVYSPVTALLVVPISFGFALLMFLAAIFRGKAILSVPLGPWLMLAYWILLTAQIMGGN
jgi:leader peptidase (prepilin peptidase)/N-methyltransferase